MIVATAVLWWILLQLFGLAALPLAFRLFRRLPDRGYALARPLGLLLAGYLVWLGGSLGFWDHSAGAVIAALVLVAGIGAWLYWARRLKGDLTLRAWLRSQRAYVLSVEVLFGAALVGWTVFKAHNPNLETTGGEKWMEIAFVSATLRDGGFPPPDPWLSGFGISYYYFGYVLMAMVTRLSGLAATVAFNLYAPTLFALTLTGAFGLVYNLVAARQRAARVVDAAVHRAGLVYGLLGAVFVGVLGNLEGLLEVLHSRGLLSAGFWRWLDIKDINVPPVAGSWMPERFMWWWRASRVIRDCSIQGLASGNCNSPGGDWEVINEFPFFSFLLGDVHPHVLALPFVLLALGLALNVYLRVVRGRADGGAAGGLGGLIMVALGGRVELAVTAVCLGALGFLNTWDFPTYLGMLVAAFALARAWRWPASGWLAEALAVGLLLGVPGVLLYLPFYLSFQSQAGGLLPNLFNPTRLAQFLVFFGPFLFVAVSFLIVLTRRASVRPHLRRLPPALAVTLLGPLAAMLMLVLSAAVVPGARQAVEGILNNPDLQTLVAQPTIGSLAGLALRIRLANPWTWLLLGGLLAWVVLLWAAARPKASLEVERGEAGGVNHAPVPSAGWRVDGFALILIAGGILLPLAVEFVYLRDNFGIRMNTVFKFYFQAWVLLAVAAAYGAYVVGRAWPGWRGAAWNALLAVLVAAGLVYPALAIPAKTAGYDGPPTLDGMAWVERLNPDDYAAIRWLQTNAVPGAVVLEAPGDRYAAYDYVGRVSALTGVPTLLGWGNHQSQWRGSYVEPARREPDIEALFNGLDVQRTRALLERYGITYVYVGSLERQRYSPAGLAKFDTLLDVVYQAGSVTIYARR
jgi:YYY domain-containing protein